MSQQRIINLASQHFLNGFAPADAFTMAARKVSAAPAATSLARKLWESHHKQLATKWLARISPNRMTRN